MSKAFTRESDDEVEESFSARPVAVLPPGARNHITPGGALKLRSELEQLVQVERPKLVLMVGEDPSQKRLLQPLDQRIHDLERALDTAVITGPPSEPDGIVRFGATVTVRESRGDEVTYRIVGVDETDLDRDWISWLSPIARALTNRHVHETVRLMLPGGEERLTIISVRYE